MSTEHTSVYKSMQVQLKRSLNYVIKLSLLLFPGADLSMGKVGSCSGPPHFRGPPQIKDKIEQAGAELGQAQPPLC